MVDTILVSSDWNSMSKEDFVERIVEPMLGKLKKDFTISKADYVLFRLSAQDAYEWQFQNFEEGTE